jgi:hypothetical protein
MSFSEKKIRFFGPTVPELMKVITHSIMLWGMHKKANGSRPRLSGRECICEISLKERMSRGSMVFPAKSFGKTGFFRQHRSLFCEA